MLIRHEPVVEVIERPVVAALHFFSAFAEFTELVGGGTDAGQGGKAGQETGFFAASLKVAAQGLAHEFGAGALLGFHCGFYLFRHFAGQGNREQGCGSLFGHASVSYLSQTLSRRRGPVEESRAAIPSAAFISALAAMRAVEAQWCQAPI